MGAGLILSYGLLGIEGLLYILPKDLKAKTRRLFAGRVSQYLPGSVQTFTDLQGSPVMVKRDARGFRAFSSVCPHLGCKVHWEADNERFFCPCHNGVFDADGEPVSGPPADAGQRLAEVPVTVDEDSGVVYLEVKDRKRKGRA